MINNILYRFLQTSKCTYKNLMYDICHRILLLSNLKRKYSSALYISGNKAYKAFAYLSPYLDFNERFANIDKFQKELVLRKMNMNAIQMKKMWDFYLQMIADKCMLEDNNSEIGSQTRKLWENAQRTVEQEQEMLKLRTQLEIIRKDLKRMKQAIWELEENVIEKLLKLPNEIDPRTPIDEPTILKSVGKIPKSSEENTRNHIDIGTKLDLIEYTNPIHHYLCNDAALFELDMLAYADQVLCDNGMIQVIGTDFCRSLIVEASGLNHEDPTSAFIIENHNEIERGSPNRMHLVGGASLASFLAMHTKQLINPNYFPLKYVATGRQYTPLPRDSKTMYGLFKTCQASVAHAFVMAKNTKSQEYNTLFEELVETVCRLYDDVCDHYRVVIRSASELQPCESLRVSFEMWSPYAKQYIEIGHVSAYGNYFTKRLLIAYQTPSGRDFPAVISGTVLSVPRLIACLLEQNPNKFVIPPKIAKVIASDNYVDL